MKIHPVTQCWPIMGEDDYAELIEDIRAKGLLHPLVMQGDVLLDGRNRLKACEELGIKPDMVQYVGDDPAGYIISTNRRRNLTPGQRAMVAEKLAGLKHGGDRKHEVIKGSKEPLILNQEQAAETMGVSEASLKRAREIRHTAPDLAAKVESGEMTLWAAHKVAKPHVAQNSGDNEWYTPKAYAESARVVMGKIDIDPASSETANKIVKAGKIFTQDNDGLKQDWSGKLWLNPPYSTGLIDKFAAKTVTEYEQGHISEALVLVNNATETRWFARLCSVATGFCFPTGRVKFWHPRKKAAPLQGQAVVYFGKHWQRFANEFRQYGIVAKIEK
jgi:hypothetical protein